MHLQVSPDAPAILRLGAALLLTAHVGGGAVGMVSGFTAMIARKGGAAHLMAGKVFFFAMLTMAGVGAAVAPFMNDAGRLTNVLAGTLTCYLVLTARLAASRRDGQMGRLEQAGLLFALGGVAALLTAIWLNNHAAHPAHGPEEMGLYVFLLIISIAAASDLHLILRRGLTGAPRIARHIWRQSVALTIATGSFFLGQPKFVPALLRDTGLSALPVLAGLVLMVFWLIRIRIPRRPRPVPALA